MTKNGKLSIKPANKSSKLSPRRNLNGPRILVKVTWKQLSLGLQDFQRFPQQQLRATACAVLSVQEEYCPCP
jgi:hypothetical protein